MCAFQMQAATNVCRISRISLRSPLLPPAKKYSSARVARDQRFPASSLTPGVSTRSDTLPVPPENSSSHMEDFCDVVSDKSKRSLVPSSDQCSDSGTAEKEPTSRTWVPSPAAK